MRIEGQQGSGDDSAFNCLRLFCETSSSWLETDNCMPWGPWSDSQYCEDGKRICGVNIRFEDPIAGDNSAMNGIKLTCCTVEPLDPPTTLPTTLGTTTEAPQCLTFEGHWGSWKSLMSCPSGEYVNTFVTRVQSSQVTFSVYVVV